MVNTALKDQLSPLVVENQLMEMFEAYLKNIKLFVSNYEEIDNMTRRYIMGWAFENKKSSKMFSKKAIKRLEAQKFSMHLKEKKSYIFFKTTINRKQMSIFWCALNYVSTPKGILYFFKFFNTPEITCFYSHFFDRMAQRAYDNVSRLDAIKNYIWELSSRSIYIYNKKTGDLQIVKENGLILGKFSKLKISSENEEKLEVNFLTNQTFISEDLLRPDQKQLCEKARKGKLKLNEDIYDIVSRVCV